MSQRGGANGVGDLFFPCITIFTGKNIFVAHLDFSGQPFFPKHQHKKMPPSTSCQVSTNAVALFLDMMRGDDASLEKQKYCVTAMQNLAEFSEWSVIHATVTTAGGVGTVVNAMNKHAKDFTIQRDSCKLLEKIATRSDAGVAAVLAAGGLDAVQHAVLTHRYLLDALPLLELLSSAKQTEVKMKLPCSAKRAQEKSTKNAKEAKEAKEPTKAALIAQLKQLDEQQLGWVFGEVGSDFHKFNGGLLDALRLFLQSYYMECDSPLKKLDEHVGKYANCHNNPDEYYASSSESEPEEEGGEEKDKKGADDAGGSTVDDIFGPSDPDDDDSDSEPEPERKRPKLA